MPDDTRIVEVDEAGEANEVTPRTFTCPHGHTMKLHAPTSAQVVLDGAVIYRSDPYCPLCHAQWTAAMFPLHEVKAP